MVAGDKTFVDHGVGVYDPLCRGAVGTDIQAGNLLPDGFDAHVSGIDSLSRIGSIRSNDRSKRVTNVIGIGTKTDFARYVQEVIGSARWTIV